MANIVTSLKPIQDIKGKWREVLTNEEILELVEKGLCPHYILLNPVTKEEFIFFRSVELNNWFEENYIRKIPAYKKVKLNFLKYKMEDDEDYKVVDEVPKELSFVKELQEFKLGTCIFGSGIYFLYNNDALQYIGQSITIAARVGSHFLEGTKEFNRVFFINVPKIQLDEVERSLIRELQPPLNMAFKSTKYHDEKSQEIAKDILKVIE